MSRTAISLGTERNPGDSSKIIFLEEVLHLANNSRFFRTDRTDSDPEEIILVATDVRLWIFTKKRYFISSTEDILNFSEAVRSVV